MATIRELRLKQDISQGTLAVLAGVGSQTIWRAEAGQAIRKSNALAICQALNVSLEEVEGIKLFSAVQAQNRKREQY